MWNASPVLFVVPASSSSSSFTVCRTTGSALPATSVACCVAFVGGVCCNRVAYSLLTFSTTVLASASLCALPVSTLLFVFLSALLLPTCSSFLVFTYDNNDASVAATSFTLLTETPIGGEGRMFLLILLLFPVLVMCVNKPHSPTWLPDWNCYDEDDDTVVVVGGGGALVVVCTLDV